MPSFTATPTLAATLPHASVASQLPMTARGVEKQHDRQWSCHTLTQASSAPLSTAAQLAVVLSHADDPGKLCTTVNSSRAAMPPTTLVNHHSIMLLATSQLVATQYTFPRQQITTSQHTTRAGGHAQLIPPADLPQ